MHWLCLDSSPQDGHKVILNVDEIESIWEYYHEHYHCTRTAITMKSGDVHTFSLNADDVFDALNKLSVNHETVTVEEADDYVYDTNT